MRTLTSLILLLTLTACQTPEPELTEEVKEQIVQVIIAQQDAILELAGRQDPALFELAYEPGAMSIYDGDARVVEERRAIYQPDPAVQSRQYIDRDYDVIALTNTLAFMTLKARVLQIDTMGVSSTPMPIVITGLWRNTDGQWRKINHHESYPD